MFNWMLASKRPVIVAGAFLLTALVAAGCAPTTHGTGALPTPQGTIALDKVKVGMPESTFKDAILTFVPDPKGAMAGKVQYLSRAVNADGGQYIVQCKDGMCYELQVTFAKGPVSKELAMKTMRVLFPVELPPQSKVDDSRMGEETPVEVIYYGKDYRAELIFDKSKSQIAEVSALYEAAPKEGG